MLRSRVSGEFLTNRAWLRSVVGGEDLILRNVSALEYLELFVGYNNEEKVDVYALEAGQYSNFHYCIVEDFNTIDYFRHGNMLCATFNQTVNDMLHEYEHTDLPALAEALSNYYYDNNESFSGLEIYPENAEKFDLMQDWAIDYYNVG